ncbi:MAG: zf-HC2 domain-containing protein, partial [Candidatus Omnitrophota bacterium]
MNPDVFKKALQKNYAKNDLGRKGTACPSEETLGGYLEHGLPADIQTLVESHLAQCSSCAEQIILIKRVEEGKKMIQTPRHLINRAKNLVEGEPSFNPLEIILRFKEELCEIIRTTGDILQTAGLTPIPAAVRGAVGDERVSITKISKVFDVASIEVNIEKINVSSFLIKVVASDVTSKKPLNDLRVSLFKEKRELESLLTQKGIVSFKDLTFNRYAIKIFKTQAVVGEILIDL